MRTQCFVKKGSLPDVNQKVGHQSSRRTACSLLKCRQLQGTKVVAPKTLQEEEGASRNRKILSGCSSTGTYPGVNDICEVVTAPADVRVAFFSLTQSGIQLPAENINLP